MPTAEVLAIGDELLSGETVDTNSSHIDAVLAGHGFEVTRHQTVADAVLPIASALREASARADVVITTGGLGPTQDDLSFEAVAYALQVPLELHEPTLARIEARFAKAGRPLMPNNRRQAWVPSRGRVLDNEVGTAPGFQTQLDGAQIYVLPGVPREMRWLLEHRVLPTLERGAPIFRRTIRVAGIGESQLETDLVDVIARHSDVQFGFRTQVYENHVKLVARGEGAKERVESAREAVQSVLGTRIFGLDELSLEASVIHLLKASDSTLVTAESCTGGWMTKLLTDVPGASQVILGGVVAYANAVKSDVLGVRSEALSGEGAVSEVVAAQMAVGARLRLGSTFALSATGIAGPEGGTEEKPVGTVWLALSDAHETQTWQLKLQKADREVVRLASAKSALDRLRIRLLRDRSP